MNGICKCLHPFSLHTITGCKAGEPAQTSNGDGWQCNCKRTAPAPRVGALKKYVVRRQPGSHTVFTFPPAPNVKGSGWAWSPTPPGGVAARPSWHAPRAVLAGTATYGARIGVPLKVVSPNGTHDGNGPDGSDGGLYAQMLAFREEAIERVRTELRTAVAGTLSRYWPDEDKTTEPACLVCVVGEPLTVVGFNEDTRLGTLPPEVAAGRMGWDAVCEVGFHAYAEVPLELANVEPVRAFPFETGAKASAWDDVPMSPFRWGPDGKRECDPGIVRALLAAHFPKEGGLVVDNTRMGPFGGGEHLIWVGLEIEPDPDTPPDAPVRERMATTMAYRQNTKEQRHARLLPVIEWLRAQGVPVRVPGGPGDVLFLIDDMDAEPFFPVNVGAPR